MSPETHIIYGPPGTGKTTELLNIVERLIRSGMPSAEICYVGFTRRSANEARERAAEKFQLFQDQLPWFRTLHSLAFQQLGLKRDNVMGVSDYLKLCEMLGLSITLAGINEDGSFANQTLGDRLFFAEAMSRARIMGLKEYWESIPDEDIYYYQLLQLHETLAKYKTATDKRDFTDIIVEYIDNGAIPACKVLIVDEAQDLSPLQWRMVNRLSDKIGETFIAGDDDQAIFRWAGADVEHIIGIAGERRILGQSYRVPAEVQQMANAVASRIRNRVKKEWKPRPAVGIVEYVSEIEQIDLSAGDWLLLARNNYLLEAYIIHCLREGFIFSAPKSPISMAAIQAIQYWGMLCAGKHLKVDQVQVLYDHMSTRIGVTHGHKGKLANVPDRTVFTLSTLRQNHGLLRDKEDSWDIALDRINDTDREYFLAAMRRGESIDNRPRIRISTIHGAKGAEANNVVIQLDMAERTWREFEASPDDEHRVWYVAITRAREKLIIVTPKTNRAYEL